MLISAMDAFQYAKADHTELEKAQYTDHKEKDYFRASELGSGDRKLIYGLFGHQLPKSRKSAHNLRQLDNGNYVHDRYQSAWEQMGVLISMEERLDSKTDEYLGQFDWSWKGHYDGLLDINILRAYALGMATINSVLNEETGKYEMEVTLDDAYANSIGLFDENGEVAEDYRPLPMVADIKTMNPWGFKRIKDNADLSGIGGYIDQIQFYMYMLNTPYGSIYIESKDNNEVVEVQIVWRDMHEGVEYMWDDKIHGEQRDDQVRHVVTSDRFFGSETMEGVVPRLERIWNLRQRLKAAFEAGDNAAIAEIFREIPRCSSKPEGFPCSWGHKSGKIQTCEFFDHCWSPQHQGMAVAEWQACPPEAIWEFEAEDEQGNAFHVEIDSRKVPEGVTQEGFLALVTAGVLDYSMFLVDNAELEVAASVAHEVAEETAFHANMDMFDASGELKLEPASSDEALEFINNDGKKAILCVNCKHEVSYQKLGAGGTKKCDFCQHVNRVKRI